MTAWRVQNANINDNQQRRRENDERERANRKMKEDKSSENYFLAHLFHVYLMLNTRSKFSCNIVLHCSTLYISLVPENQRVCVDDEWRHLHKQGERGRWPGLSAMSESEHIAKTEAQFKASSARTGNGVHTKWERRNSSALNLTESWERQAQSHLQQTVEWYISTTAFCTSILQFASAWWKGEKKRNANELFVVIAR